MIHNLKAQVTYTVEYEVRDSGTDDSKTVAEREQEWISKRPDLFLETYPFGKWETKVGRKTRRTQTGTKKA